MQNKNNMCTSTPFPSKETFVRVKDYIPDIAVDLQYASSDNFTGHKIYDFHDAWLRYGTVEKLAIAQNILKKQRLRLKIWDAFRPVAAQFVLWAIYPDDTYVANPNIGFSWHSRGNTVDVTIINDKGAELLMPTPFDNFYYNYELSFSKMEQEAATANFLLLKNTMITAGFRPYDDEWWHFYDLDEYAVDKEFLPK